MLQKLIKEADLEHFNVPIYHPTIEEVKKIIKEDGSFIVERLESINISWDGASLDEEGYESFKDENERGEFVAKKVRAVYEPILKAQLGEGIIEELFVRFQNKVVELLPELVDPTLVISLTKIA